ncbi:glutathione S-transferase [Teratosphaeria nubilosa]|uniref:Glutathione S-transferase n=1 Tax=Teratosphaeria nubilosa TaxID=161662 RepID=A0A6G1L3I1_9PEZI|nr:glutathione S-transferase [Teratosphaeria nubilosa]
MSNLKPLILHAHSTGPNPYKVAITLSLLNLPYTIKLWQFGSAPNGVKGPQFLSMNPNGRVPALEDPNTGVTAWESGACVNYLLRVYDRESNKLGPKESEGEQGRVDFEKWIFFLVSTLGPMMGQVNWFRHYHSQENEDALKRYEEQAYRCFGVLEGQLRSHGGGFILPGAGISAVDVHFYPWVYQHGFARLSLEEYPAVAKWLEKVAGLKEVKEAYERIPKGEEM